MDKRVIQTLMHRLFYGDIDQSDGWRHLVKDGHFNRELFESFLDSYIPGESVLIYQSSHRAVHCQKPEAFEHVVTFLPTGPVHIADPRFRARLLINPIGVGVGRRSE